MDRIGVIGLGRMGSAIAARLAARGQAVSGWTRSGLGPDRAAALGIAPEPDLAALVASSDVVILSLFDDAAVAEVLDRLAGLDLAGRLVIETSTIAPETLTARAAALAAAGASAVDAPISGGPEMVAAGVCGIFLGGADPARGRAQAVLAHLSDKVFPVGPLGAGYVMKAINNSMLQVYMSGLQQLLPVARAAGLELETVLRILASGPAGAPFLATRMPKILGQDPSVGFTIAGGRKDNRVFRAVAAQYGVTVPALEDAGRRQDAAIAAGLGDRDPADLVARAYDGA